MRALAALALLTAVLSMDPRPERDRELIFGRSVSTVAIHEGLVYATEFGGFLQCLDAQTGKQYWKYDLQDSIWNSPYYVDGKVFLGTDGGDLFVFEHGKTHSEQNQFATAFA